MIHTKRLDFKAKGLLSKTKQKYYTGEQWTEELNYTGEQWTEELIEFFWTHSRTLWKDR
jgi:hypothetical protein